MRYNALIIGIILGIILIAIVAFIQQRGSFMVGGGFVSQDDEVINLRPVASSKPSLPPIVGPPGVSGPSPQGSTGEIEEVVKRTKPSVVFIRTFRSGNGSEGTGWILRQDGYIVTCQHVVNDAVSIRVLFSNGIEDEATVIWQDDSQDLALIKVQHTALSPLSIGDISTITQGHRVIAIGYPLGSSLGTEPTVTDGLLSAIRQRGEDELFQISAPINPGNSGGPLLSVQQSAVIGIVSRKISKVDQESGTGAEGLGFAVPMRPLIVQTLWRQIQ